MSGSRSDLREIYAGQFAAVILNAQYDSGEEMDCDLKTKTTAIAKLSMFYADALAKEALKQRQEENDA